MSFASAPRASTSPPVIAAAIRYVAASMRSGMIANAFPGRSSSTPSTSITSLPSPAIRAPIPRRKVASADDLRLTRGVLDHAPTASQDRGHQDVLGPGDGGHVERDVGAAKRLHLSVDVAALELELATESLEALEVLVDRPHTDRASAREGDMRLAAASEQRSEREHARSHLAHEIVGRFVERDPTRVEPDREAQRALFGRLDERGEAHPSEEAERGAHVDQIRHVPDLVDPGCEERRDEDGERRVLGAAHGNGAPERHAPFDDELVHVGLGVAASGSTKHAMPDPPGWRVAACRAIFPPRTAAQVRASGFRNQGRQAHPMKSLCPLLAISVLGIPVACNGPNNGGGNDDSSPTDDSASVGYWDDMSRQPSTADTYNGVYANGPDVWVAVSDGAVERWDGGKWTRFDESTEPPIVQGKNSVDNEDMRGIWGDGSGMVVAVGDNGKIATWTGAAWLVEDIGTPGLNSVDGPAVGNLMVGGWGGIYNNQNGEWQGPADIGGGNPLMNHLWYNGTFGIAVGQEGARATYGGSGWASNADAELRTLYGVHALGLDDAWAVGERGLAFHYNGEEWSEFPTGTEASLWAVWMVASDSVYAVGNNGTAVHWNGTEWSDLDTGGRANLYGIYGVAENDIWACGASGALYHYVGAVPEE